MKRVTSQAPFVQKFRNVYIVLSKNIITIHTETNLRICLEERLGGGGYSFFWPLQGGSTRNGYLF